MTETMVATEEKTQPEQTLQTDSAPTSSETGVQSVEFPEVQEKTGTGPAASIDILLDMEVPVTVLLGRAEVPVQQLLQLGPGAVMKMNNTIDTPVELYLKDTKFAIGDVVVVEDKFAIRIRELVSGKRPVKPGKN